MTGNPRARASVTTMPYVSAWEGRTNTSAVAYAEARSWPVRSPEK